MTPPIGAQYVAGSNYVLTRDEPEKERLNKQHEYVKLIMYESRLIYDRNVQLGPGHQVLDAGTGTGEAIWLQELSKQVPSAVELFGCDVSANNFPTDYPANMKLSLSSVTSLPEEWTNKFDFVNQRLLMAGLRRSEWPVAISELFRVLKPGAPIQLMEMDLVYDINWAPATKRFLTLGREMFDKRELHLDCSPRLEGLLKEAGFEGVRSEKRYLVMGKAWGKIGELGKQNFLNVFRNAGQVLLALGIIDSEGDLTDILNECAEEWDRSEYGNRFIGHLAYARKPLLE